MTLCDQKKFAFQLFLVAIFLISNLSVLQAANTPVPSRESAGVQEAKFKEEKLEDKKKATLRAKEPEIAEKEAAKAAPAKSEGARFLVKSVKFLGNHSFPDKTLEPFVANLVGREVTLGEIQDAVSQIKKFYREHGFIATYVYIPEQQLLEDTLKIDIMEGRLGELKLSGNRFYQTGLLQKQFRLKTGDILRFENLRRDLVRLNNNPDIKTKAVMEPGKELGTTDLAIQVEDRSPIHLSGEINNQGTRSTGKERYGLSAMHDNLFGYMDKLGGAVQLGRDSTALGTSYSVPLSYDWGTRLGYSFVHADVDVKGDFAALQAKGKADMHNLTLTQPILESEHLDADARLGFDAKRIENRQLGIVTGKDDLRILDPGLDLDFTDPNGKTFSTQDFNIGLGGFMGGSEKEDVTSRLGTGDSFFVYRGMLVRYQKLMNDMMLSLKGNIQVSGDSLPPSEQVRLGGAKSIRGYAEGDYLGDYGGYLNLDLYIPPKFMPVDWKLPASKEPLSKQVQIIGFFDWGTARLKEPAVGEIASKDLAGVGAGLRVHLYENFYGRVEWGFRVGDKAADNHNNVFHFTVSYEFL